MSEAETVVSHNPKKAIRRGGRVVEGARLLSECTGKTRTAGSNPALSVRHPPTAILPVFLPLDRNCLRLLSLLDRCKGGETESLSD